MSGLFVELIEDCANEIGLNLTEDEKVAAGHECLRLFLEWADRKDRKSDEPKGFSGAMVASSILKAKGLID